MRSYRKMKDDVDICPVCEKRMKKRQCVPCKITFEPLHRVLNKEKVRPKDKGLLAIANKPRKPKIANRPRKPKIATPCQACWTLTKTKKEHCASCGSRKVYA